MSIVASSNRHSVSCGGRSARSGSVPNDPRVRPMPCRTSTPAVLTAPGQPDRHVIAGDGRRLGRDAHRRHQSGRLTAQTRRLTTIRALFRQENSNNKGISIEPDAAACPIVR